VKSGTDRHACLIGKLIVYVNLLRPKYSRKHLLGIDWFVCIVLTSRLPSFLNGRWPRLSRLRKLLFFSTPTWHWSAALWTMQIMVWWTRKPGYLHTEQLEWDALTARGCVGTGTSLSMHLIGQLLTTAISQTYQQDNSGPCNSQYRNYHQFCCQWFNRLWLSWSRDAEPSAAGRYGVYN
jgi:hypothetical protein